jgi:uncharacterized protein YbjT (DUF2867 family)
VSGGLESAAGEGPVLVTGSSGTTGSRITAQLTARGVAVIAANRAGEGPAGTTPTRFDWHDPATHPGVLAGVRRMYLVPPIGDPDPSAVMLPFLEQARLSGVQRVVLLSNAPTPAGGPGPGIVHQAISEMFDQWAVLRPSWFMQNVTGEHPHARMIRRTSTIVTATGDHRVGFIDAGDIARAGVEALLAPEAPNADLILTGPQAMSYGDMARVLSEASGRAITHVRVAPEEVPARYEGIGVPARSAQFLAFMDLVIASGGQDWTTDTVERVTGTPPRTIGAFAAAEFRA